MTILVVSVGSNHPPELSFPAPCPFHPGIGKRRHHITYQSPIRPSATLAAPGP